MCFHKKLERELFLPLPSHWIIPWRVTDTGISQPVHKPDHFSPGVSLKWSCANWNYSTAYTAPLRKPGLLKQNFFSATSCYFVLALKRSLPPSSILNTNISCTSNNLEQYISSRYFCEILWSLYHKCFLLGLCIFTHISMLCELSCGTFP